MSANEMTAKVRELKELKARRQVDVDLRELWENAAQAEPIREENQEAEEERKNG